MTPANTIRVLIVEDQPLFRSLLGDLVRAEHGLELLAATETVAAARDSAQRLAVDVLLADIDLPDGDGFTLARSLRTQAPALGVVLLSAHDVMDRLLDLPSEERGRWSYLSKTSSTSRAVLLRAIRASAEGSGILDPAMVHRLQPRRGTTLEGLTPRQLHALRLLAQGLSNSAMAADMGISVHSVDNLLNAVYTTLGVRDDARRNSRVEAVLHLLRDGSTGGAPR